MQIFTNINTFVKQIIEWDVLSIAYKYFHTGIIGYFVIFLGNTFSGNMASLSQIYSANEHVLISQTHPQNHQQDKFVNTRRIFIQEMQLICNIKQTLRSRKSEVVSARFRYPLDMLWGSMRVKKCRRTPCVRHTHSKYFIHPTPAYNIKHRLSSPGEELNCNLRKA